MTLLNKFIDQYCFVQGSKEEKELLKEIANDEMLVVSKKALEILLDKQKEENRENIHQSMHKAEDYIKRYFSSQFDKHSPSIQWIRRFYKELNK